VGKNLVLYGVLYLIRRLSVSAYGRRKPTKADLIEILCRAYERSRQAQGFAVREFDKVAIKWAVENAVMVIANKLGRGEKVVLQKLGTFTVERSRPRKRHDVRTGLTVERPGRRRIKFKPAALVADFIAAEKAQDAQERRSAGS